MKKYISVVLAISVFMMAIVSPGFTAKAAASSLTINNSQTSYVTGGYSYIPGGHFTTNEPLPGLYSGSNPIVNHATGNYGYCLVKVDSTNKYYAYLEYGSEQSTDWQGNTCYIGSIGISYTTEKPIISLSCDAANPSTIIATGNYGVTNISCYSGWLTQDDINKGYYSGTGYDLSSGSAEMTGLKAGGYTLLSYLYFAPKTSYDTNYVTVLTHITLGPTDTSAPTGSYTLSTSGWTNKPVTINVNAADASGVQSIKLPNGTIVNSSKASYSVSANGTYIFVLTDTSGNTINYPVTVSNIDTTPPTATYTTDVSAWTCGNVNISVNATDKESGIASIAAPDGTVVSNGTISFTAKDNGTYVFTLTDKAGNITSYPVTISNIDRTVTVTHSLNASYTIDPNTGTFTSTDILITNNSPHIGVKVSAQSLKSTGIGDAAPDKYADWNTLTAAQTSSEMALGIKPMGSWLKLYSVQPVYAAQISGVIPLGVLNVNSSGCLSLAAKYGTAWSPGASVTHNLVLLFDACNI